MENQGLSLRIERTLVEFTGTDISLELFMAGAWTEKFFANSSFKEPMAFSLAALREERREAVELSRRLRASGHVRKAPSGAPGSKTLPRELGKAQPGADQRPSRLLQSLS